ncbi:hypothetical protein CSA56_01745 [candidate division KSB3 bacterium]|uniref:DUF4845 domain-containing protein n=1 Tax=candidate division KSB3 bacterium TaxID=2044937 RepID=A0A2G6KK48_9BACT|nr:MAG: hypothetical protein CSA56_01745 [candidate division KSB3 bacterium]
MTRPHEQRDGEREQARTCAVTWEHIVTRLKNERGNATVTIIIVVLVIAIIGFAAIQLAPLYWDHANIEQVVHTTMISEMVPPYQGVEAKVAQKIMSELDVRGALYEKEHIRVHVNDADQTIQVEMWYSRPHHLPFYQNPKLFYLKLRHKPMLPKSINIPTPRPLPKIE